MTGIDIFRKLYHSQPFWTITGVITGFGLGQCSSLLRDYLRIRRLKHILKEELKSAAFQIDQKKDIIRQALEQLALKKILPTRSVRIINKGYTNHITELYPHLSAKERNSLHVIYEHLRVTEEILDSFDADISAAVKEKVMTDPLTAFRGRLNDVTAVYDLVKRLIRAHLQGTPEDVFYINDKDGFTGENLNTGIASPVPQ